MALKLLTIVLLLAGTTLILFIPDKTKGGIETNTLRIFTSEELSRFNGSNPQSPTYLAMDGLVYDISAGRDEYYAPGKPYDYLAGRDASDYLRIAGGGIIKTKYPVVGKLIK